LNGVSCRKSGKA